MQIWDEDENQNLATILTIPNTRFETPDESKFELEERPSGSPMALKVWYFPGNQTGEEFVYSNYPSYPSYSSY